MGNKIDLGKRKILLVTGNGFDLACDIRSKYADYFRYLRIKNFNTSHSEISKLLNEEDYKKLKAIVAVNTSFSLWELYLAIRLKNYKEDSYDIDWFDIETEIKESLKQGAFWDQVFDYIYEQKDKETTLSENPNTLVSITAYSLNIRYRSAITAQGNREECRKYFNELLKKELNTLERNFGKFLKEIATPRYKKLREENIGKISDRFTQIEDIQILTFNYTSVGPSKPIIHYVHGDLNNPIFGIDVSPREDIELNEFTKTNRRRSAGLETYNSLLNNIRDDYALVFYGTSFSDIDMDDYKYLINRYSTICALYSTYDFTDHKDSTYQKFRSLYKSIKGLKSDHDFDLLVENGTVFIENIEFDQ